MRLDAASRCGNYQGSGHEVLFEGGVGSGYEDEQYRRAGGHIVSDHDEIFDRAELIVKVKEPIASELALTRPQTTMFTLSFTSPPIDRSPKPA